MSISTSRTRVQRKLHKLAEILKYNSAIRDFNFVKSHQVHFIQLADILMGAINYHLRIQRGTIEGKVRAKRLIVEKIKKQTNPFPVMYHTVEEQEVQPLFHQSAKVNLCHSIC